MCLKVNINTIVTPTNNVWSSWKCTRIRDSYFSLPTYQLQLLIAVCGIVDYVLPEYTLKKEPVEIAGKRGRCAETADIRSSSY